MMTLNKIQLNHEGTNYEYDWRDMTWRVDGRAVYPKTVPNAVKSMRELLIGAVAAREELKVM